MFDQTCHSLADLARTAILIVFSTVILLYAAQVCSIVVTGSKSRLSKKRRPRGPTPWPLLGNLPTFFSWKPCETLVDLARIYGPVMAFKVGTRPSVVISSSALARDVIKTQRQNFCLRPVNTVVEVMNPEAAPSYGSFGERWRQDRKLFTQELMSINRLDFAKVALEAEVLYALRELVETTERHRSSHADEAVPEVLLGFFNQISGNVLSQMVFGKRLFRRPTPQSGNSSKFATALTETFHLFTAIDVRDMLPVPKWFDPQRHSKRLAKAIKELEKIIMPIFDARRKEIQINGRVGNKDFVDTLFSVESTGKPMPDALKKELAMVISCGTFTVGTMMDWALAELLRNPAQIRKCQEQLDAVVGKDRLVSPSDLPQLPFVRAIVLETLRLHPSAFTIGPCVNVADCEVGGYFIPAKTAVLINVNAINRDPSRWTDPDEFKPDRHLQSQDGDVHFDLDDFSFMLFGAGRRSCPGRMVGWIMSQMVVASFLQAFDLELPPGVGPEDVRMTPKFTIEFPIANSPKVIPRLRIPRSVLLSRELESAREVY